MRKLLFTTFMFLCGALTVVQAQNKLYGPATSQAANVRSISPNGKYLTGYLTTRNGFLWDIEANELSNLQNKGELYEVTDDKIIAGLFPDPNLLFEENPINSGGVWQDGTWTGVGLGVLDGEEPHSIISGSSLHCITANGNTVAGHSVSYPDGSSSRIWPYSWTKKDGKWEGQVWKDAVEMVGQGSSIRAISADGSIAVGWSNINGYSARSAILWKSPDEYELLYIDGVLSTGEYTCISNNGKYAAFKHNEEAGIHNLETGEITMIPGSYQINDISDNGIALGVYRTPAEIDKGFVWSKELDFMDFGDFISVYVKDVTIPNLLQRAFNPDDGTSSYALMSITPDGLSIAIWMSAPRTYQAYVLSLESSVEVIPYPRNLTATTTDRNKVTLNWEAPEPVDGDAVKNYVIYKDRDSLDMVAADVLTYTHEDAPSGYFYYRVQAIYESGITSRQSDRANVVVVDTYELPFHEGFDSDDFLTNFWTAEIKSGRGIWLTYENAGVEGASPGAALELVARQEEYSAILTSKPLDATNLSSVYLSYMVFLRNYTTITSDTLLVDIYDGAEWKNAYKYYFPLTVSDWKGEILDISEWAAGKMFQVRFRIDGNTQKSDDTKFYFIDDIIVDSKAPIGGAVPEEIITEMVDDGMMKIAWQDPSSVYGITHSKTFVRSAFGNEGKVFIAAQDFDAKELAIYSGMELTAITVYINQFLETPTIDTKIKLAVFKDGTRVVDQEVLSFTPRDWNTFSLDMPLALTGIENLKIGIEVAQHDSQELPVGADESGRVVKGKGDLYSEDGGTTWEALSDEPASARQRNWCIIGSISDKGYTEKTPKILGYNIYRDGEKINEDLVFGQSYVTDNAPACYTIRAYSLLEGLSGASKEKCAGVSVVEASVTGEGAIDPAGYVYVNYGDDQAFTFTANAGHELKQVLVDGNNVPEAVENGSYTFSNVLENHTIQVVFEPKVSIPTTEDTPLRIYPNPTAGKIFINNGENTIGHIQLFDITGRLLQDINSINNVKTDIDLSDCVDGIYFLNVDGKTIKIIKH